MSIVRSCAVFAQAKTAQLRTKKPRIYETLNLVVMSFNS